LSTAFDHHNLLIIHVTGTVDNTCGTTQKSTRTWASFLSQWQYSSYYY